MVSSEHPEAAAAAATASAASTETTAAEAGNNQRLAAGAATSLELSPREEFVIECLRNARYHEDRERFFARIHRTAMFLVVASGTATFAWVKAAPYLTALLTLAGLLDLVFDVSGKARLHASLRRRVYDLLAQAEDPARSIESLREQAVRVYADEPPCMHAANLIAFNGAMDSLHRPRSLKYKIGVASPFLQARLAICFYRVQNVWRCLKTNVVGSCSGQWAGARILTAAPDIS